MRNALMIGVIAALLVVALGATSCAPLNASSAIGDAEDQLEKAKKEGADKNAPYEYYLAWSYLVKAKKTEGYSEFGAAEKYAVRARDLAKKAITEGRENMLRQKILNERLRKKSMGGGGGS